MAQFEIPFNRPMYTGKELDYIQKTIKASHYSGDGEFTRKCSILLKEITGASRVLLTTSCTHALEMCALLLDIQPGDEVILPSFSFVTTANAFALRGARPVFVDIHPDTLNLNEQPLEQLITSKTKAVVALHYAGVGCEMDSILDISERFNISVIEDNALGLFGKYKGQPLGSFGALGALSFHETKSFTCGEGGALLINQERFYERAEILREKGTNRSQFIRGQVDKYTWVDLGSSYLPADILAAFLLAQLEEADRILKARKKIWESYTAKLSDWAVEYNVGLPALPPHCESPFSMFYILCPSAEKRTRLFDFLKTKGIQSVFHYIPLHLSKMGQAWGYREGDMPITEDVSNRIARLPFYYGLTSEEQDKVCRAIIEASRDWEDTP